nr:hypothetical protein [Thalassotalea sp. G2M2-11]
MAWQLYRAKQFTGFKKQVEQELKAQVIKTIQSQLKAGQTALTPNNDCHVQATINYWCQYPVRIVQYALAHEIISKESLIAAGNYRHCQHLFHVQRQYMHHFQDQ